MTVIPQESIRSLIPHAGAMCLLDTIESWNAEEIQCTSTSQGSRTHPLRRGERLSAIHLIELAAQSMAAHGALLNKATQGAPVVQPGMLAAARSVRFSADRLDHLSRPLRIISTRRLARPDGLIYDFVVRHGSTSLCEGRLVISLIAA